MKTADVRVKDVYQDLDYRQSGRKVEVQSVGDGFAVVQNVNGGAMTRIRLDRLRPITPRKGFRLVHRDGQDLSPEGVVGADDVPRATENV